MKITVAILLLSALCNAEQKITSRSKKAEEKSNKRELVEGNAGVEKRAPVFSTVSPSFTPGIEYADSKENERDKSPSQIYTAPISSIAKISDLLSGHGPSFPTAIASHLYAPVSAYQARIPTYQVSAPVPSRLAYSEKITYQPNVQYQRNQNAINPQQKLLVRYNPQPQQVLLQQPVQNQQQIFQQIPQYHPNQASLFQSYQPFPQNQVQQYYQSLQQPGMVYAKDNVEKPVQRDEKPQPIVVSDVKPQTNNRNYKPQQQTAVSYASFSQSQPSPHPQAQQYQPQPQQQPNAYQQPTAPQLQPTAPQLQPTAPQLQPTAPQQLSQNQHSSQQIQQPIYQPAYQQIYQQIPYQQPLPYHQPIAIQVPQNQYQIESQNYQPQNYQPQNYQPQNYQPQNYQPQNYQLQNYLPQNYQPQLQYRPLQQAQYQLPQNQKPLEPSGKQTENLGRVLLKSGPVGIQSQQLTPFQNDDVLILNNGFGSAPTFPPVQYFGKFAESIFGNYQH